MTTTSPDLLQIVDAVRGRRRFVLSSHSRPDGDSIGSQLAMAYALRTMGKEAIVVNADAAPAPLMAFPGVRDIRIAPAIDGDFDAAIIMECGDLKRTGVAGLERFFVINIDHHPGNTGYGDIRIAPAFDGDFDAAIIMECGDLKRTGVAGLERCFVINIDHHPGNTGYGDINWFDASAAACAEMVYDLVRALGVPLTKDIATHIYLAILTDTGSFHYSSISPRTFDICRECLEAGVDPVMVARNVYDSNNMGRLKLFGAVLGAMQIADSGRIAIVYVDHEMARAAGGTYEDTEGLVNLPLTVKEIEAVLFFKQEKGDEYRVSLRSKGEIDIGVIAKEYGGGGHKNAAGCTIAGPIEELQKALIEKIESAIDGRPADR